tara:strand:- start:12940 stop:13863 length:924 start_codon:yes stop_codon:yes gene_type:complete
MPTDNRYTGIPSDKISNYDEDLHFSPSTFETIDYAMFDYMNDTLSLRSRTNKGWEKTPVVWVASERSFQMKNSKEYRDDEGLIILPVITIERSAIVKDLNTRGAFYGNQFPIQSQPEKGGSIVIARRIKQDKTSNFANANANRKYNDKVGPQFVRKATKKVVYEYISIPPIVYVEVTYSITLRTEYQQQMNDLVQPFITRPGTINSFMITRDGHRYETFVQGNYALSNNVSDMTTEERKFETKVDLKVLGYLIGEGDNQDTPKFSVRENAVEVRIPREHVVWDDSISVSGDGMTNRQNTAVDGKYRE